MFEDFPTKYRQKTSQQFIAIFSKITLFRDIVLQIKYFYHVEKERNS